MAYGTLIGAVRHRGFIPWDDDIDILMPIEDYQELVENYQREGRYGVLDYTVDDEYFFPFAKFVDHDTYLHHLECPTTWMQAAYIDIFPLSGFERGVTFEEQWRYHTLLDVKWYWYYLSRDIVTNTPKDPRAEILHEKYKNGYEHADQVGVLTTIPAKPWILEKNVFEPVCQLPFEGGRYPAPGNYDRYLTDIYGDYRKVPPLEEQRVHGFPSYRRIAEHGKGV